MSKGTHDYTPAARNAAIKINVNGELVPRDEAKVSVFDAGYVLGDVLALRGRDDHVVGVGGRESAHGLSVGPPARPLPS